MARVLEARTCIGSRLGSVHVGVYSIGGRGAAADRRRMRRL